MNLNIFKNYNALSAQAVQEIVSLLNRKPDAVLSMAAGDTPRLAYQLLCERAAQGEVDLSKCTFIGLDEWIGIPPENEGSCFYFLQTNLFRPLGISPSQIHVFDSLSPDLMSECRKMDSAISHHGGIDLMLVGVGMNGHIGFNEPGVSEDLYTHVVALDDTTKSVGQKYFKQHAELQYGITLGLKHLRESKRAIMIASGEKKSRIMKAALEGPVTMDVPASIIRKHLDGVVMLDEDAGALLEGGNK